MAKSKRQAGVDRWNTIILYNHYLWCKKEGRDTNWYDKRR